MESRVTLQFAMPHAMDHPAYASFSQRLLAHNIDLLLVLLLFYLYSILPANALDSLFLVLIFIGYHSAFELSSWRATPGKRLSKIYVMCLAPESAQWRIVLRNALKPLSVVLLFAGIIMMLFNRRRQTLHDYIAGTIVRLKE